MSRLVLAATLHDSAGGMLAQVRRVGPLLAARYAASVVLSSPETPEHLNAALRACGMSVVVRANSGGFSTLGSIRRAALADALARGATAIHACDLDRALHWAELWPDELDRVLAALPRQELTILGRTSRAFATHPRNQRDTEALINEVFGRCYGEPLDVTAAARGVSAAAARYLIAHDDEPSVGVDCTWPLLLRAAGFHVSYIETEGLEFETADREAAAIARAGGRDAWLAQLDSTPSIWQFRIAAARAEIDATLRVWLALNSPDR